MSSKRDRVSNDHVTTLIVVQMYVDVVTFSVIKFNPKCDILATVTQSSVIMLVLSVMHTHRSLYSMS